MAIIQEPKVKSFETRLFINGKVGLTTTIFHYDLQVGLTLWMSKSLLKLRMEANSPWDHQPPAKNLFKVYILSELVMTILKILLNSLRGDWGRYKCCSFCRQDCISIVVSTGSFTERSLLQETRPIDSGVSRWTCWVRGIVNGASCFHVLWVFHCSRVLGSLCGSRIWCPGNFQFEYPWICQHDYEAAIWSGWCYHSLECACFVLGWFYSCRLYSQRYTKTFN